MVSKTHKGILCLCLGIVLLTSGSRGVEVLAVPHALAQEVAKDSLETLIMPVVGLFAFITENVFYPLLIIVLWMLQYLLSPQFFLQGNMNKFLGNIWVLSRDITNVLFAMMLIGVAVYTIITANKEFVTGKIKHFVLAVILVNFSWFFPRVIIDVSNIVTATVYSIPSLIPGYSCQTREKGVSVPCKVLADPELFPNEQQAMQYKMECKIQNVPDADCKCYGNLMCYKKITFDAAVNGNMPIAQATINGLAVSFLKIASLPEIPKGIAGQGIAANGGPSVAKQIAMSTVILFLFTIFLLLPLIALGGALLIRILVLWVTIAFMPFAFLGFATSGKLGTNIFGMDDYIWKHFIQAVFLPVMVAVPMTVGIIMLSGASSITPPGGMVWRIPLLAGVDDWWTLLWMCAALMIIWTGTFAALSKSEFSKGFTDKVKGFGDSIGSAAQKIPGFIPAPLPGLPRGTTLGSLANVGRDLSSSIDTKFRAMSIFNDEQNINTKNTEIGKILESDAQVKANIVKLLGEIAKSPKDRTTKEIQINQILKEKGGIGNGLIELRAISNTNSKLRDITESIEKAEKAIAASEAAPKTP